MTRSLFTQIVSVFYWICNLCIAFTIAIPLFILYKQLSDSKGTLSIGENVVLSQGSLSNPIFKVPVTIDLGESFMDTTILFRSKATPSLFPETYQVKTKANADESHHVEHLKKRNNELLKRYQMGLITPSDTIISSFSLTSDQTPINAKSYFGITPPKEAKGFLQLKATNMHYGWLILACTWLQVIVQSAFLLFMLFCINLFLQDIRKYQIFTSANFRRLRWVGISLLVFSLLDSLDVFCTYLLEKEIGTMATKFEVFHNSLAMSTPFKINIDNTFRITFNPFLVVNTTFLMGLAIIILAEIFRKGHELQQEQELTI